MMTTRINIGAYECTVDGRKFQIEDLARVKRENGDSTSTKPDWQLYETTSGNREWWNDFATLKEAKAAILRNV